MINAVKRFLCRAELAELARLRGEVSELAGNLRIAELAAIRLEQEKDELLFQLTGERKKVRTLRKRSRRK